MRARLVAHKRWSKPGARQDHGAKISAARLAHHEELVDPDGRLDPLERRKLAYNSLRAEMAALAFRSSKANRARKTAAARDGDKPAA
jgi:hypothetical protein